MAEIVLQGAVPGVTFFGPVVVCSNCGEQHGLTKRYRKTIYGLQVEAACTGCEIPRSVWLDWNSIQMRLSPLTQDQARKAIEWVDADG